VPAPPGRHVTTLLTEKRAVGWLNVNRNRCAVGVLRLDAHQLDLCMRVACYTALQLVATIQGALALGRCIWDRARRWKIHLFGVFAYGTQLPAQKKNYLYLLRCKKKIIYICISVAWQAVKGTQIYVIFFYIGNCK
jgi:hypothetical protein